MSSVIVVIIRINVFILFYSWPQIKAGDADAYRKFQNFLVKCKNIDHLQSWSVMTLNTVN